MRITKKDHLQKIRAEVHDSLYVPTLLKMNIGMATCGIAAGAKEVYDRARESFKKQDVVVARTGWWTSKPPGSPALFTGGSQLTTSKSSWKLIRKLST